MEMPMKEATMSRATGIATTVLLGGCLGPLVDDAPGASVHILPAGASVPGIADDPERLHQITVHDGLDDDVLAGSGGVVPRSVGWAAGAEVQYWDFGAAPRVGAPIYVLVEATGAGPRRLDAHPYLLDSIPGDPRYSPLRRIQLVHVTPRYRGELLTSLAALDDAIELGLVDEPVPAGTWVNAPVVPPGTRLEVGATASAAAAAAFAGGYQVDVFPLGGDLGVQPLRGNVPLGHASLVREAGSLRLSDAPVFQWGIPAEPPTDRFNYTPLVAIVEVDLAADVTADMITADAELFRRAGNGNITGVTAAVDDFEVTDRVHNWPIQFVEGAP
jgi:hypothetical protein